MVPVRQYLDGPPWALINCHILDMIIQVKMTYYR